jgi:hypothetical protein
MVYTPGPAITAHLLPQVAPGYHFGGSTL